MMPDTTFYSYHTFMFPFVVLDDENFSPEQSKWGQAKKFEIKSSRDFNEYNYFYPYVQDVLYQRGDRSDTEYFEYKVQSGTYTIQCLKEEFSLEVDGISLRLFSTGVGILSFNLKNTQYPKPEAILAINDFGRRIYPAFLGEEGTTAAKKTLLAHSIILKLEDHKEFLEDFSYFDDIKKVDENPYHLPKFISALLGEQANICPIIDDRMFVLSLSMNDDIASGLGNYENNDLWYQYLFIDGNGKTCQSKKMTQQLLQQSTYDRWLDYGTLFGISRYSFVCATKQGDFANTVLLMHMKTMYFQMFSLLLAYKASILKFAHDITKISKNPVNKIDEIVGLHEQYLKFMNNLFFKEVTAQDQGIELFDKAMSIMNIEKSLKDLQSDIAELHAFADLKNEKRRANKLESLSKLGSIFLPATLVSGILGMNTIGFNDGEIRNGILSFFAIALSIVWGYILTKRETKHWLKDSLIYIIPIVFIVSIFGTQISQNLDHDKKIDKLFFDINKSNSNDDCKGKE